MFSGLPGTLSATVSLTLTGGKENHRPIGEQGSQMALFQFSKILLTIKWADNSSASNIILLFLELILPTQWWWRCWRNRHFPLIKNRYPRTSHRNHPGRLKFLILQLPPGFPHRFLFHTVYLRNSNSYAEFNKVHHYVKEIQQVNSCQCQGLHLNSNMW